MLKHIVVDKCTSTQHKCKACDKTVYLVDQLTANGIVCHKSCFKCNHCKGTLTVLLFTSLCRFFFCSGGFQLRFFYNTQSREFDQDGYFISSKISPYFSATKSADKAPELVSKDLLNTDFFSTYFKSLILCCIN
ncbi:hypothetical protein ZIOFF_053913 [Zingiber officinale]|uniref:LIM zinc-binding domain-containing protein n=1 Tax=Zingiber officinale TaxID=94328 RepID=A0A8J5KM62_ZINOF|nr:hypothetical protein ZIOFF_053913 [Zingiber officinale]